MQESLSGIRLRQLIQHHHFEILNREKDNIRFVHLYNIGMYWVAFERSACRLNDMFRRCEITLFRVPDHPDYVVMASIPVNEADIYFRKHWTLCEEADYKVLSVKQIDSESYHRWHVDAVRSVLY